MKLYIELEGALPAEISALIPSIRNWMSELPEPDSHWEGKYWTCHGLCRAAKSVFELTDWLVCDGHFDQRGQEHTWLMLEKPNAQLILDVYPIALYGGPLLIDAQECSPWREIYKLDPTEYTSRISIFEAEATVLAQL